MHRSPRIEEQKPKNRLVPVTFTEVKQTLSALQGIKVVEDKRKTLSYVWTIPCDINDECYRIGIRIITAFNKDANNDSIANFGHSLFNICLCETNSTAPIHKSYRVISLYSDIVMRTKNWKTTFQYKAKNLIRQAPNYISKKYTYNRNAIDNLYKTLFTQKPQLEEGSQTTLALDNIVKNAEYVNLENAFSKAIPKIIENKILYNVLLQSFETLSKY